MSNQQIERFLAEQKTNTDLQQKLKAENITDEASFIKAVHEAGFEFTAEEWKEYAMRFKEEKEGKLSDDELSDVSGGGFFGLTKCPGKYDTFLCQFSLCPNFNAREIRGKDHTKLTYFCSKGLWDNQKAILE